MKLAIIGSTGLVGSQLVAEAHSQGHQVVGISRGTGRDVTQAHALDGVLADVDAIINVIQAPDREESAAREYFRTTSTHIGEAAKAAAVERTVLLSILGADRAATGDQDPHSVEGYYRAKYVQEQATLDSAPAAHILRSSQFHNLVGQVLGMADEGETAQVPALSLQPIESAETVRMLLELATSDDPLPISEVAGPRAEWLPDLARAFLEYFFEDPTIEEVPVSEALTEGLLLASSGARVGGRTFHDWLRTHPRE